ncbi:divalent-cation tolerance protein CutA [Candidatus Micrarchaeota archaeon]|nr:divalent-cation tolerance protein CutA [Candidatus Micrarchaeota archaeon]
MLHVYITFPTNEEAKKLGRILIKEKLAKCINIHKIFSIYPWKGRLCEEDEFVMLAKTSERKYKKLEKRIKELHSYELPPIVAIKVEKGHRKFISWVEDV